MELENVKQHDVKDEAKEAELLDLEEAPLGRVEPCLPRLRVRFMTQNDAWRQHQEIFGEYQMKWTIYQKPAYESDSGIYAIWYSQINGWNRWNIGLSINRGTTDAIAYVTPLSPLSCPDDPVFDWFYEKQGLFIRANTGLTIVRA